MRHGWNKCGVVGGPSYKGGAFGMMGVTRRSEKILMFVGGSGVKICFYGAILD